MADGSGLRFLTKGRLPQWSPRGDAILFVGEGDVSAWELDMYLIAPDGSDRRLLATVPCTFNHLDGSTCSRGIEPQWSPDGAFIAFSARPEPPELSQGEAITESDDIFILNADGTGLTNITNNARNDYGPVWVDCQLPLPTVGCEVIVKNVQPQRLNLRDAAGTGAEATGKLAHGDIACLLGSPAIKDGIQWWPLSTTEGIEGWAAVFDPDEPQAPWLTATGRTCHGSPMPSVEVAGMKGFRDFAPRIESALAANDISFFVKRALDTEMTCPTSNPQLEHLCTDRPPGAVVRFFHIANRFHSSAILLTDYQEYLERWLSGARPEFSDDYGAGHDHPVRSSVLSTPRVGVRGRHRYRPDRPNP